MAPIAKRNESEARDKYRKGKKRDNTALLTIFDKFSLEKINTSVKSEAT
jgi:hypothetical protein